MAVITYKKAGVDIDKANRFVEAIKALTKKPIRPGPLGKIGGFSGFFKPRLKRMKEPLLVAATDGVGTKLLVAEIAGRHDTIGIDLVAMNTDDVVACGAEPLFFLDYFACGRLNDKKAVKIMKGILEGCRQAGVCLLGGETAEMPGVYRGEEYDLAGFCVGIVDRKKIIDGRGISAGDVILGIASSGMHSNGYSLARKVFSRQEMKGKFKNALLRPTKIYTKAMLAAIKSVNVKGIAHITGGGFYDNIIRILPKGKAVVINPKSWAVPQIFKIIKERARLNDYNMYRTFNMGVGMVLVIARKDVIKTRRILRRFGHNSYLIGEIVKGERKVVI